MESRPSPLAPRPLPLATLLLLLLALAYSSVFAQSVEAQNQNGKNEENRGEFLIAPIPISSPTIGTGLEWLVGYVFPFSKEDKVSPNSFAGVGGLFTDNGSRGIFGGGRLYLKEDRFRFAVAGGGAKINADFSGVGNEAGDRGVFVPLTTTGSAYVGEFLIRTRKGLYLGGRFQYRNLDLSLNQEESTPPIDSFPELREALDQVRPDLFKQQTVAVGPRLQLDTRDTPYYPRKGVFLESGIDVFMKSLGSEFSYQYYKVAFNKYMSLARSHVLAVRATGCAATGDHVPIYDLCLFGISGDLRGYAGGQYQDRRMVATQAEYRLLMPQKKFLGRFGIVAFGGVGGVADKFSDLDWDELLPAGGAGLRFRLTKKDHINFRIDYGIGKAGDTLTVGVGEAF